MSSSLADSPEGYLAPHSFSNLDSTVVDPIFVSGGEFVDPPSETNEECYALREWRRHNTVRLEEKEKREKELLSQIIFEAEDYKLELHRKTQIISATTRVTNREKEQEFVAKLEKFHVEAERDYWKSIAELIPKEVPALEKRKGKREQEKASSLVVVEGPKPGRPTDLSRMRHLLLKLKHNTPPHLKQSPAALPNETTVPITNQPMLVA